MATPRDTTIGNAAGAAERARFLELFAAVMLPMFLAAVDQTIVATATPAIGHDMGHLADMPWLAVGYLIGALVVVPLYGQMGDHFGRRRVLTVAIGVFTVGSLACGLASGFGTLVAARVLQGLGGGGLMSLSQALIGEVLPPRQRAKYQAYFAVVFVSASLLGPLIGAAIVESLGWRWLFLVNVPLAAFALWRLRALAADDRVRPWHGRYDWAGTVAFSFAAVGTLWLLNEVERLLARSGAIAVAAFVGVALAWVAVARIERGAQRRGDVPFLPVDLLAMPAIRTAVAVVIGFAAVMFANVFYLPVYMHLALGGGASESALLLLPLTGGIVLGSGLTGRLMARTGRTREFPMAGMALAAVALAAMSVAPPSRGLLIALSMLTGAGLGTVMSTMQIVTQITAGPARLGGAAASVSLGRSLGASAGAAAFGALLFGAESVPDLAALRADPAALAETIRSFHHAFAGAAVLAALTAVLAGRLPPIRLTADDTPGVAAAG
jgi:MFS family permease